MHTSGWTRTRVCRLLALLTPVLVTGCASPYLLTVEDTVSGRGKKAQFFGKLEYRGVAVFNPGVRDRNLRFYLDDRLIGIRHTDDKGYAKLKHPFPTAGDRRLLVTYEDGPKRLAETAARIFVWDRYDPILVVDIDDTLCQTRVLALLADNDDPSPPLPGAPETLQILSRRFHIVYLTGRPREMIPKTRRWLEKNQFPVGPVLTWDIDKYPWSQADYKKKRIDKLQDDFENVTIGIGNTEKDYQAYRKRKLFSIILTGKGSSERTKNGVHVPDWSALRRLFALNPHLYGENLSYKTPVILPR
jgi:hypothetical protein